MDAEELTNKVYEAVDFKRSCYVHVWSLDEITLDGDFTLNEIEKIVTVLKAEKGDA